MTGHWPCPWSSSLTNRPLSLVHPRVNAALLTAPTAPSTPPGGFRHQGDQLAARAVGRSRSSGWLWWSPSSPGAAVGYRLLDVTRMQRGIDNQPDIRCYGSCLGHREGNGGTALKPGCEGARCRSQERRHQRRPDHGGWAREPRC